MKEFCYVIVNNAGHSWQVLTGADVSLPKETSVPVLQELLSQGWEPVRETPMGGGTSPLAHSLILLEKSGVKAKMGRNPKPR